MTQKDEGRISDKKAKKKRRQKSVYIVMTHPTMTSSRKRVGWIKGVFTSFEGASQWRAKQHKIERGFSEKHLTKYFIFKFILSISEKK